MAQKAPKKINPRQKLNLQNLRLLLKQDRTIRILCVVIAFIFWLITKLSYSYKDSIKVQVDYLVPEGKVFTYPPALELEVFIEAKGWELLGYVFSSQKRDVEIEVLENEIRTISSISLTNKIIDLVPDASILNIVPENLQIQTENKARKIIPVLLDQQIRLAPLHQFADTVLLQPSSIEIEGPASVIRNINQWKTNVFIPAEAVSKDIDVELSLVAHPNATIKCSTNSIRYRAKVEEVTEKKLAIPIDILDAPDSLLLVIIPKKIELSCSVGLSDYKSLKPEDFKAVANFGPINVFNQSTVEIELTQKPSKIHNIQYSPKKATYIIRSHQ